MPAQHAQHGKKKLEGLQQLTPLPELELQICLPDWQLHHVHFAHHVACHAHLVS